MARNAQADVAPQAGGGKGFALVVVAVALAGGGYYALKQFRETGELPGMDAEKSAELAERAKEFKEKGTEKFGELLTESRELLGKRKAGMEAWFKERDIKLPTRDELVATADKYLGSDDEDGEEKSGEESGGRSVERGAGTVASRQPAKRPTTKRPKTKRPPAISGGGEDLPTDRRVDAFDVDPRILAKREFWQGFERWKSAPPNSPDEQGNLRAAREHFTAARDHFQRAMQAYPDDPKLEEYVTDCNRFIYDCMKRTVLDVH